MYSVIIADDDATVRKYLEKSIDWNRLNAELRGTASDGQEALELILKVKPDLAVIDIDMPILDGVEILEAMQDRRLKTKVLVLSCYDDFEYVKNAMRFGAVDYLLKHKVDAAAINSMIGSLLPGQSAQAAGKESYDTGVLAINADLRRLFTQMLIANTPAQLENIRLSFADAGYPLNSRHLMIAAGQIDHYRRIIDSAHGGSAESLDLRIISRLNRCCANETGAIPVYLSEGDFILIYGFSQGTGAANIRSAIRERLALFAGALGDDLYATVTFGVSGCAGDITNIGVYYNQANYALQNKLYLGVGRIIEFNPEFTSNTIQQGFYEILTEWERSIRVGEHDKAKLQAIFDMCAAMRLPNKEFQLIMLRMLGLLLAISQEWDIAHIIFADTDTSQPFKYCETIGDYRDWFDARVSVIMNASAKKRLRSEIIEAMEYIAHNLRQNIDLAQIAAKVHLSKTYFSQLFKQVTGESVSDYITRMRVEQAKKLLLDPNLKMYEIALELGFESQHYFARLFKSQVGMTPTEYRLKNYIKP